jgi:ketosteroid isomerase-like protein
MVMLGTALCLVLVQGPGPDIVRIDWSAAAGADTAIAGVRRDYVTAINARDRMADAFYTRDAVASLASGAIVSGAPAVTAQLRTALEADGRAVTITLTPMRFVVEGATGSETGTFVETVTGPAGAATTVEGIYVTVYSRAADGQWRIAMEARTTGSSPPLAVW